MKPLTFEPVCEDFVSIEINQDLERGLKYMVHSKYCLAMGEKYREYIAGRRVLKVPMKIVVEKALLGLKPTEEAHAEVANFPYRELIGTIAFPTNHTKIECKCAVAVVWVSCSSSPADNGVLTTLLFSMKRVGQNVTSLILS